MTISIRNSGMKIGEYDSISFFKNPDGTMYNFSFLKLTNNPDVPVETDTGFKFIICLYGKDELEVFEAILGDPLTIVSQYANSNEEGLIVKKCPKGQALVEKIQLTRQYKKLINLLQGVVLDSKQ